MNVIIHNFCVVSLHVLQHAVHQFGTLQSFDITRPVIDIGRRHQLTALFDAGDDNGLEIRPCRIHCSRITGGAGAKNQNPAMFRVAHV